MEIIEQYFVPRTDPCGDDNSHNTSNLLLAALPRQQKYDPCLKHPKVCLRSKVSQVAATTINGQKTKINIIDKNLKNR